MTFAYKLSQSFSAFLAGIMLDIIGFDASKQMSQTVFASLGWLVLGGVFLVLCISIVFFVQYGITKKDVKEITIKLSED